LSWSCAVRLCERQDLEKVAEIERSCFDEPYEFSTFSYLFSTDPQGFLVAECEGRVVGYAIGQLRSGRGLVISLAVDPAHRGGGVGESLLKELLEHFQRKHVKSVELQVDIHNSYAIKLYEKMGFQVKKTIREYYSSGKDAYLMSRILDRS